MITMTWIKKSSKYQIYIQDLNTRLVCYSDPALIQWGSEIWTCLVLNGQKEVGLQIIDNQPPVLYLVIRLQFKDLKHLIQVLVYPDHRVSIIDAILSKTYLKYDQNVQILNGLVFEWLGP